MDEYADRIVHLRLFEIGFLKLNYVPLGMWLNGLLPHSFTVHVAREPLELPDHLHHFREAYEKDIDERRDRGETVPTNGDRFSVFDVVVGDTKAMTGARVHIALQQGKYYDYQALLRNLDKWTHRAGIAPTSLRHEYLLSTEFNPFRPFAPITDLGVGLTAVTSDDRAVFVLRGRKMETLPDTPGTAVAGGVYLDDYTQAGEHAITHAMLRQTYRELGITVAEGAIRIPLFGVALDGMYGPEGVVFVEHSFGELRRHAADASDRFEIEDIFSVPARPFLRAWRAFCGVVRDLKREWHPGFAANFELIATFSRFPS